MRILLVEDNPGDIRLLQEYLKEGSAAGGFQITQVGRLSTGLERLAEARFDAVLLDLALPDSQGLDTLVRLHGAAKAVPIVVLTGIEDEALGVRLIQAGAQDYLVKGQVTGHLLTRSLRYAAERKRVEEELGESEARLRAILDNSPNLVFLKDTQGRYLHINRQFERAFHISCEAIAGKTDKEVFPAEQAAAFHANDLKVFQAGVLLEFEEVALHDDGPHTSIVFKFPLYGGDGKPYALCGITTDITERKVMEEALRQAEEKYRSIFDNAVEGIFQSTSSGRYLSVNPAMARMYGYASPEELMGSVTDIAHEVYVDPDCREALTRLLERQGVVRGFEYEVYRKDGSTIWISESVRAVRDGGGKILYYEGTIEDITERRRAEEERKRLAAMIESSNDAIMSLTEGRVSFWNPAAEKLFGYSSEEILGKSVNILVPSHLLGEVERNVERILRGEQIQDYETERVRKDGSIVPVSLTVSPLKDAHGKIVGPFAIIRDITERKRAEEELQRTLGELRTLSRRLEVVREDERTRIARELHDELGVRLTCLKMDLSRLRPSMNEASRPKLEETVLSMIEQVDTTIAAVQGLVAELRPGVLDDLGLVAAIEWQCLDFERRSGIRCLVDSSEEDIPMDSARATAAFRICQEALTNVVRHARAKEIRVHLDKLDRELLLEIHDDGQGILPEKVTDARSLGLLGMRERAGAVGGALRIVGLPGHGTTVTLRLPCE
jgi:PAS domain S-box-containing protein